MAATHQWVYNAETKGVWECPLDYLPTAKARGWVEAEAPAEEFAERPEPDAAATFDPSEHTVAEVNEYLADATDVEVERVLDAEHEGKNRKGITDTNTQPDPTADADTENKE